MLGKSSIVGAVLAAVSLAPVGATDAGAQGLNDSWVARIRGELATGNRLRIAPADGASWGLLIGASEDALHAGMQDDASGIAPQQPPQEAERRDSPWNGLLIGATLGAALGFGTYTECEPVPPYRTCEGNLTTSRGMEAAAGAALFGAIGMTVDLLTSRSPTPCRGSAARRGFAVTASPARVQAAYRIGF